jgi:hypothetical protein
LLFVSGGWWRDEGPYPVSAVFVFDTQADSVEVLESDRCVYLGAPTKAENGDIFFYGDPHAVGVSERAPCTLVIRDGER